MKKIKDLETALKLYEEAAIKQGEAVEKGEYKINEKYIDIGEKASEFLEKEKAFDEVKLFFSHPSQYVRICAAGDLLSIYEEQATAILEEIAKTTSFASLNADIILNAWTERKGGDENDNIPKIKNLETALTVYEEAAIKQEKASIAGYDAMEEWYDTIVNKARNFIKKENAIDRLEPFLAHSSQYVRICAACDLVSIVKKKAVQTLEEIAKTPPGIHSLQAKMILDEWREGNL